MTNRVWALAVLAGALWFGMSWAIVADEHDAEATAESENAKDDTARMRTTLRELEAAIGTLKVEPSAEAELKMKEIAELQAALRRWFGTATSDARGGTLSAPAVEDSQPQLRVIHLEYAPAEHVAEIVAEFLPDGARVAGDNRTNKLILLTPAPAFRIATAIIKELDVSVARETVMTAPDRPDRPRYEYEMSAPRRSAGDVYGAALREDLDFREREIKPFERLTGVVVSKGDSAITIQAGASEATQTLQLPTTLIDEEWRVVGRLAAKVSEIAVGDEVIVEWWEAEDVRYVEDIATVKPLEAKTETFLLD